MAIEQAGLGQHHGAGVDAAQGHAFMVQAAQPCCSAGVAGQRLEAGHHQQQAYLFAFQRAIGVHRHAVAGQHRPPSGSARASGTARRESGWPPAAARWR
jgi:hypothetical protein